ncbi:DUF3895 domain-containing protein [Bacillus paranthracis]|uniref:DUF3895 domain-containing protein n=1 Tax=Bacillus paranthracis TaxID=2026186 RepID=A0A5M9GFS1_9BACI|nr:DUF3895 domain-containing protein [Bacillus paranthracis]KAA8473027.1 DUF3895 domain-containing protein [Bacillus paranthracis]QPA42186.1 DUF3895 domain-containing protein [Bacillus paranthracis]
MKTLYLSQTERDSILSTLSSEQKDYLNEFLKRGKRTAFASVLAQQKGDNSLEDADHISIKWTLLDFIDAGTISDELKCECGRSLRYQYIVKNLDTGKVLKFGKSHFQEHTNIPADIVKEVINGMLQIDYELDEILIKLKNNWSLELNEGITLPADLDIPLDIQIHLDLQLPLLEKQIHRLLSCTDKNRKFSSTNNVNGQTNNLVKDTEQISLFEEETLNNKSEEEFYLKSKCNQSFHEYLDNAEKEFIDKYIVDTDIISTRLLCELLIKNVNSYNKRYSSGKPYIYSYVSNYLDYLYHNSKLSVAENFAFKDRIYFTTFHI